MRAWQDYSNPAIPNTVAGSLRVLPEVYSPQLENVRSLLVYLPPSYQTDSERRYPVIYMHDGQNLFDRQLAFGDEWQVDETLLQLAQEGLEAIVVGIPHNEARLAEYSPFVDRENGGGRGDAYLAFLVEIVKPIIDEDFRTRSERDATGILGSSMGGLISLYAFFSRPQVFGFAGALSPSIWFGDEALLTYIDQLEALPGGKIYLDAGHQEAGDPADEGSRSAEFVEQVRQLRERLTASGYVEGENLMYIEDATGTHSEADWARRLPDALRFLSLTGG